MFQNYKILSVKRISVDEVYAWSKKHFAKESRDKRFFTIASDLDKGTSKLLRLTSFKDQISIECVRSEKNDSNDTINTNKKSWKKLLKRK